MGGHPFWKEVNPGAISFYQVRWSVNRVESPFHLQVDGFISSPSWSNWSLLSFLLSLSFSLPLESYSRLSPILSSPRNRSKSALPLFSPPFARISLPASIISISASCFPHWPLTLFLAAVVQPSSLSLPLGEPPLIRNTYGLSFATIKNPCSRNPFSIRPRSLASFVLPTGLNSLLRRIGRNRTTLFRT